MVAGRRLRQERPVQPLPIQSHGFELNFFLFWSKHFRSTEWRRIVEAKLKWDEIVNSLISVYVHGWMDVWIFYLSKHPQVSTQAADIPRYVKT